MKQNILILIKPPMILTKDKEWAKHITPHEENRGEILTLPDDAIIVVQREDQDTILFYNKPILLCPKT